MTHEVVVALSKQTLELKNTLHPAIYAYGNVGVVSHVNRDGRGVRHRLLCR